MNHFMARLIFCFFSEDTDIFSKPDMFTDTVRTMSESDSSNTHEIIQELFRAMNTNFDDREKAGVARWANSFPYVNGGLFAGGLRFQNLARLQEVIFSTSENLIGRRSIQISSDP